MANIDKNELKRTHNVRSYVIAINLYDEPRHITEGEMVFPGGGGEQSATFKEEMVPDQGFHR